MRLKSVLIIYLIIFANQSFAFEQVWKMGSMFLNMNEDSSKNILYSNSCSKKDCLALRLTKDITFKNLRKDSLLGGKNPGAVLCKEVLKMKIVYLKDMSGNENTFCLFNDNSMISSSSIAYLANLNEKKIK